MLAQKSLAMQQQQPRVQQRQSVSTRAANVDSARQWISNFKAKMSGGGAGVKTAAAPNAGQLENVESARQWIANFKAKQAGGAAAAAPAAAPAQQQSAPASAPSPSPSSNGAAAPSAKGSEVVFTAAQLQDVSVVWEGGVREGEGHTG